VKRLLLISIITFILINSGFSQDPQFSQFYANPLYLAPSFTGATEEYRIALNHRNQWPALPGVFLTYSFSFDRYFEAFNSGVGLIAVHDRAGSGRLSNTLIGILYSYDFNINNNWHVRPGASFQYVRWGLDFNRLIFNDQLSPGGSTPQTELPPFDNVPDIDFSSSVLVYNSRIWFGTTVDHLLKPNQSLYGEESIVPMKISVYGGAQIIRKGRLLKPIDESLSTAFNFKTQGGFTQLDLGVYWYKNPLVFGVWWRGLPIPKSFTSDGGVYVNRDAVILLVGYKTSNFHIGYSYDFTISGLLTHTGGAHEIAMVYEFRSNPRKKRKLHAIPCPEF
jgi:type IX secretion system PorP/SprF family membrane protein